MRTRYGISPWISLHPETIRPEFPRAKGALEAEVVVIGGGITGCAIAHALATSGHDTLLLDAGRVGQSGSGRSAGLVLTEPGAGFKEITARQGLKAARLVFAAWEQAAEQAVSILKSRKASCPLEPQRVIVAGVDGGDKALRREHDARQAAGLDSTWLDAAQVVRQTRVPAECGLRLPGGVALSPYRAALGLLASAPKKHLRVCEKSAVSAVTTGKSGVTVKAGSATVTAQMVVVATGTPTAPFTALQRHFKLRERYLVLTEPLTDGQRKGALPSGVALLDTHAPSHLLRWTPDGRLLLSGGEQDQTPPASRDAIRIQRTGQLMYELLLRYPSISGLRPEFGWEAVTARTPDGLPCIGAHGHFQRHLFAMGGEGDSLTGAFVAADLILRAVEGRTTKADAVFGWGR